MNRKLNIYMDCFTNYEKDNLEKVLLSLEVIMDQDVVVAGAVMPDACPSGHLEMPVGCAVLTSNAIFPFMHSMDVNCSIMASNLMQADCKMVMDRAYEITHFGKSMRTTHNELPTAHELYKSIEDEIKSNSFLGEETLDMARWQLGTQGDGNHFLSVGRSSSSGDTFMLTHHGSRGLGAYLYNKGIECANKYSIEMGNGLGTRGYIPHGTFHFEEYSRALDIVKRWTIMNHRIIHDSLLLKRSDEIFSEHNCLSFIPKDDKSINVLHAKGSVYLPSGDGLGIIPTNMRDNILIVKPYEGGSDSNHLGCVPHGAGRIFSRNAHVKGIYGSEIYKDLDKELVKSLVLKKETEGLDVRFYSGNIDLSELPSAYKGSSYIKEQIQKHKLANIVDEIAPIGCIMYGRANKYLQNRLTKTK